MNFMLGAELFGSWKDLIEKANVAWAGEWLGSLLNILSQVMWVAMALVGAAGAIYAIYVGVKMARADSAEAREENKKRLINIIVSIIVVIVLVVTFNVFVPMIVGAVIGGGDDSSTNAVGSVINIVKCLVKA